MSTKAKQATSSPMPMPEIPAKIEARDPGAYLTEQILENGAHDTIAVIQALGAAADHAAKAGQLQLALDLANLAFGVAYCECAAPADPEPLALLAEFERTQRRVLTCTLDYYSAWLAQNS